MGRKKKTTKTIPITVPVETHPAVEPVADTFVIHAFSVPVTVSGGDPVTDPCRYCGISTVVAVGTRRICTYPPCGKDQ